MIPDGVCCVGENVIDGDMVAGEPLSLEFIVTQNDLPLPLTGYSAKIELRQKSTLGNVIQMWDDDSPELVRNDAAGTVVLTIPADVTDSYTFQEAYTDLLLQNPPAGIRSATVRLTLKRGVTRV